MCVWRHFCAWDLCLQFAPNPGAGRNGLLVHNLSCLALGALVLLPTPARCRVNGCLHGKELKSTRGLEPGCIKEKLMTDIYMEMSIKYFLRAFGWLTGNVLPMETNWIVSQPSAFVSPEL